MSADFESPAPSSGPHSLLRKLLSGLLLGVGFGIGLVIVLLTADLIKQHVAGLGGTKETVWRKRFTPEAKLTVEHHEARATRWNLIILGSVRNDGPDSWDYVRLEVRLLDEKSKLVGLCTGSVNGPVRPGKSQYFRVDCRGSESEPAPAYTKYDVEIVNAGYEMENGA